MTTLVSRRRGPALLAVGLVVFAFWKALLAGGSLVSADIVATAPPFDAYVPEGFSPENGPGDPINIHAHWASLAADVRSGDVGWWDRDLAGGQPTMKGGLPVFDLAYLLVPAWYAPGLVAFIRALTALGLAAGFLRAVGVGRFGALAGGLAFAFSGFMVGWMNWPHSSVAALAPGLLWAVERLVAEPRLWRAGPLAAVVAAMVWANFPPVTIYVLLGAAVYAGLRLAGEWTRRSASARVAPVAAAGVAAIVALLLAAPHVVGFSGYLDWADTSHRATGVDDSSAGMAYLLTAVAPAIWGSDAVGPAWFGEGNWVEFNAHVGASVTLLALYGVVAGLISGDRRRRAVSAALAAIAGLGVTIAYAGGPLAVLLGDLTGSQGGLMTRAKVLWALAVALGAGLGVDRLTGPVPGREERRVLASTAAVLVVTGAVMAPFLADWLDTARALGVAREAIAASTVPALAVVATVALLWARRRLAVGGEAVGWALLGVLGFELLSFAMPVPTIVDRDERLRATPAHEVVREVLEPGERLAGEGRTFFPATTELFDIADARGQVLKSPGYQELLRAVDPAMLRSDGGGTPTYPNIAAGTDVTSTVWDAMAVGVWAQFPRTRPPGRFVAPGVPAAEVDPAPAPLVGSVTVPTGGIRAVVFEVFADLPGRLDVRVRGGGLDVDVRRTLEPFGSRELSVALEGEDIEAGTVLEVAVSSPDPPGRVFVSVDEVGGPTVGTVAAGDGLRLVRAGDVTLIERPTAAAARLADAVEVIPDPVAAADRVAHRRPGTTSAVVDRELGLAAEPDPAAELDVVSAQFGRDRTEVDVRTDRAALLVVSQVTYPGWRASVDGSAVELVTADAAFAGVPVPAGEHTVVLEFSPEHLGSTMAAAAVGVGALLALIGPLRRRRLRSPAGRAR